MKRPDPAPDAFEDRLAAQPFRAPLPEWQSAILSAARLAAAETPARRRRLVMPLRPRHAWAGLAAAPVVCQYAVDLDRPDGRAALAAETFGTAALQVVLWARSRAGRPA